MKKGKKAAMVSLGCAKNLVNSEQMLYLLREAGWELTGDTSQADVNIVNTCGFIESARQEAVDNILELTAMPGKIVAAGCLAELVKTEIFEELPEVSAILGCGSFDKIVEACEAVLSGGTFSEFGALGGPVSETPRVVMNSEGQYRGADGAPPYSTYLKISEGCENRCSYCAIPSIRGPYVSRPMDSVLAEAEALCRGGIREIILVAQDLTRYGADLYGEPRLAELITRLCQIEGLVWLRLHYLYPDEITDELIETVEREQKVVKYLDIPIQHCNSKILSAMNRRGGKLHLEQLFSKLRTKIPDVVLRTSLITGFPGETEAEHTELCGFLMAQRLERVGIFTYSREPGTPAADLDGQVPEEIKQRRQEQLFSIQNDVMDAYNKSILGRIVEVLCEGYDRYAGVYFGRSYAESPEVDGKIFFTASHPITTGCFVKVKLIEVRDGEVLGKARG